jgi:transcriptional regulator with XRE-family HTH domain
MTHKRRTFGELLRDTRIEKGFSLRKFAELLGVSPTYLSQVEQGNVMSPTDASSLTAEQLRKLRE